MNDVLITIIGFSVVFVATALGSALVFFIDDSLSERHNASLSGFAAGIMVAASVFSLLLPSIESFDFLGGWKFFPTAVCFMAGGLFFALIDLFVKHVIMKKTPFSGDFESEKSSGASANNKSILNKPVRLFTAMTIHNLPEGLAVGFAFGSAAFGGAESRLAALGLAIGIAVQNFPEGAAVSLPMKKAVRSPFKAFLLGSLSGLIEPIAAAFGFLFSTGLGGLLPYVMAFAAGTMVFVVVEDLLPEAGSVKHTAWGFMAGFALMMALDIAL